MIEEADSVERHSFCGRSAAQMARLSGSSRFSGALSHATVSGTEGALVLLYKWCVVQVLKKF